MNRQRAADASAGRKRISSTKKRGPGRGGPPPPLFDPECWWVIRQGTRKGSGGKYMVSRFVGSRAFDWSSVQAEGDLYVIASMAVNVARELGGCRVVRIRPARKGA